MFKQRRYGFDNELIEIYEFRSMHADLSDVHATSLVSNGDLCRAHYPQVFP